MLMFGTTALLSENYNCYRFRKRYSGEYEGMSTTELGGDLRRDVEHYRGLWRTARGADTKVDTMNLFVS